jgi:aminopeptidase C
MKALTEQLGARPPRALAQLEGDQLRDLAQAIRDARRHQADELRAAREQSLSHIPKLLRGPVRRVVG